VRTWGSPDATPLIFLHGIRDASITFQFVVDALQNEWFIIAPDWRGHGGSGLTAYQPWFHDYLADLDALLDTVLPDQAVRLVGHSLGGNVASVYAGIFPPRVSHLVSIDAFALPRPARGEIATRLHDWLQVSRSPPPSRRYRSIDEMARRLQLANARLPLDKALFLAASSSREVPGGFSWLSNELEPRSMPTLRALDDWLACWKGITARKLWISASDIRPKSMASDPEGFAVVLNHIGRESVVQVPNTGHNIHHDAPKQLAHLIESFMTATSTPKRPIQ